MTIERTCKIILTPDEVKAALTMFIQRQYLPEIRSSEACLDYAMFTKAPDSALIMTWGLVPAAPEESYALPPIVENAAKLAPESEALLASL